MSTRIVCAVYDTAAQSFGQPIYVVHRQVAIRSFTDECNRSAPDNSLYMHADDYDLWYLSTFDEETGAHISQDKERLCRGKDVKAVQS